MQAVKLCSNKIPQFLTVMPVNIAHLYNGRKKVLLKEERKKII